MAGIRRDNVGALIFRKAALTCLMMLFSVAIQRSTTAQKAPPVQPAMGGPILFDEIAAQSGIDFSIDS